MSRKTIGLLIGGITALAALLFTALAVLPTSPLATQSAEPIIITNTALYQRLRGYIILRVQSKGEAYYVHPHKMEMHYLGRPSDMFRIMKEQGVGITNEDLFQIQKAQVYNDKTDNTIDVLSWGLFKEEKEGVKVGVLPNFKYPKNWYTYNISGGNSVEIFFSDGGEFNNQNISYRETVNKLYTTEVVDGTTGAKRANECKFSITYNGKNKSYKIRKFNLKEDNSFKEACNAILSALEDEVPKVDMSIINRVRGKILLQV